MRTVHARIFLITLLITSGCAGLVTKPDATPRSPLEIAELTYVQGSVFYEAGQDTIRSLRARGLVSQLQWNRFDQVQKSVQNYAPIYERLLGLWRSTGHKPPDFDATAFKVIEANNDLAALLLETKR